MKIKTLCLTIAAVFMILIVSKPSFAVDTDGDGLPDDWEINGYDHNNDGIIDVDLPAMGADPLHKDIFVEIDWMKAPDHNHRPKRRTIRKIIRAFRRAPVRNPDGTKGIRLHVDRGNLGGGNVVPHDDNLQPVWTEFDAIKAANFAPEREPIFHYCVFAHNIMGGSWSGISKGIPGSDFIVSLGSWPGQIGTPEQQAGTFMHELGHNLNLKHGGVDHVNYKPNFLSVMNYFFQTRGLYKNGSYGRFDYSRFKLPALDENCLDEPLGLNGPPKLNNYGTRHWCGGWVMDDANANNPIDWNCDGDDIDWCTMADINDSGYTSVLAGSNKEWKDLVYDGGLIGPVGQLEMKQAAMPMDFIMHELTVEEDQLLNQ